MKCKFCGQDYVNDNGVCTYCGYNNSTAQTIEVPNSNGMVNGRKNESANPFSFSTPDSTDINQQSQSSHLNPNFNANMNSNIYGSQKGFSNNQNGFGNTPNGFRPTQNEFSGNKNSWIKGNIGSEGNAETKAALSKVLSFVAPAFYILGVFVFGFNFFIGLALFVIGEIIAIVNEVIKGTKNARRLIIKFLVFVSIIAIAFMYLIMNGAISMLY